MTWKRLIATWIILVHLGLLSLNRPSPLDKVERLIDLIFVMSTSILGAPLMMWAILQWRNKQ